MKALSVKAACFIFIILFSVGITMAKDTALVEKNSLLNINNISFWANANGTLGSNPFTGNWGVIFPHSTGGVIYREGIVWGGQVNDGVEPALRVGGQAYLSGMLPGIIQRDGTPEDPNSPDARIWRIRRDWETADLTNDAAELFNVAIDSVTEDHIDQIRAQYQTDWDEWPWEKGAPFYDDNDNGIMDSGEQPGIWDADQVIWFAANDLNEDTTKSLYGSPSIGMEMQVTLWAYNADQSGKDVRLNNIIFKKIKLIYKGTLATAEAAVIDSMYLGQWVDTELGYFGDDYAGCDTTLQLGYGYNSTTLDEVFYDEFQIAPPAFGYTLIQGPQCATATGDGNIRLSSFWHKATGSSTGDPEIGNYEGTKQMYNLLRGYLPRGGDPFRDMDGNACKFMVAGDPVAATGWYDGLLFGPGDRRYLMSGGPFSMALGDTQEVVLAMAGGHGSDNLASVDVLKWHIKYARYLYLEGIATAIKTASKTMPVNFSLSQNYPNPFNAQTRIRFALPERNHVKLSIHNMLGETVKVLVNDVREADNYSIAWDGTDQSGRSVSSGVYVYKLTYNKMVITKKMLYLQ